LPTRQPDSIKSAVIQQWLEGKSRDLIAADTGLSSGAVTNIIEEWRQNLGSPIANDLRELAVTLKKIGITANQCAAGFRIAMILIKCGVGENEFLSFVSQIYDGSKKLGLSPEKIISHLKDLLYFSESMSLSQIRDYVKQKASEKRNLEKDIENMRTQIRTLEQEKSHSEELRDDALENEKMTTSDLKWISDMRSELEKYQIPIDNISLLSKTVDGIRQYDYDPKKVILQFSDLEFLKGQQQVLRNSIKDLELKFAKLKGDCTSLEEMVNSYNQMLMKYNELEDMGFGLKELKLLYHTINEIAVANNISVDQASPKFYKDIEEQYDDKLGFELKLDKLRSEISSVNRELNSSRAALLAQPLVGPALQRLFYNGIREQDIIDLSNLFERYRRSNGNIDKQSLMAELEKYGDIESTMQQLSQKLDQLKNEVLSLESRRNELNHENRQILNIMLYYKEASGFFRGATLSLRNEILTQLVLLRSINLILKFQVDEIKMNNIIVNNSTADAGSESLSQLMPLVRAAKLESEGKGELVPIDELKNSVIRAIGILINNLNHNNNNSSHSDLDVRLIEILNQARIILEIKRSNN
jgi:hypothetical protein